MTTRRTRTVSAAFAAMLALAPAFASAQGVCPTAITAPQTEPLSLVLSGGGARGLAHIGVLRVLDSLGVRPSLVVGTSMGALIGALYAGGLSGRQIDSLTRALPFGTLFRRYAPITLMTTGDFSAPVTVLSPTFVVELRGGRLRLQSPVAREPQINALFNQILLRANLTAAGDFDRLPRRFRAVATDMRSRSTVVLSDGDLVEAVRASIAIPVVFAPVLREGRLLVDGGLSANVPVGIARGSGATRALISDVGASLADSTDGATTASMLSYLIDELFSQAPDSLGPDDLRIRPAVRAFSPLEFTDAAVGPLIDAGYRAAALALRGCAPARSVVLAPSAPVADAAMIADRLGRLADEGVYETVWLRPRRGPAPPEARDSIRIRPPAALQFTSVAAPAPEGIASMGVSYDGQSGARAWVSVVNPSPAQKRVTIGSGLSVSQWRQQFLFTTTGIRRHAMPSGSSNIQSDPDGQVRLPDPRSDAPPWSMLTRNLLRPEFSLTASREIVRLYDERGREQDRPSTRDLMLFAGAGITPSAGQRLVIGPVAHLWATRSGALPVDADVGALGGMARAVRWFAAPSEGPDLDPTPGVAVEAFWLDKYKRFDARGDFRFQLEQVILRPRAAAGWGERLPLAAQFILGGAQGFPGLRTGERRGDRTGYAAVAAMRRIDGPFYARAEAGVGRSMLADPRQPALPSGTGSGWVEGVDLGLITATPLGSFSISIGAASNARTVFKISLGS